jgi:hypothetical protein
VVVSTPEEKSRGEVPWDPELPAEIESRAIPVQPSSPQITFAPLQQHPTSTQSRFLGHTGIWTIEQMLVTIISESRRFILQVLPTWNFDPMSSPNHPDLIVGTILGGVFSVGLVYVFAKAMQGRERPASMAIFVAAYFMTIGVGLSIVFIIAHFILKHW